MDHQWNAVNVVREDHHSIEQDEIFQRGLVVGKGASGLFVDFGLRDQLPELIPYHNVYRSVPQEQMHSADNDKEPASDAEFGEDGSDLYVLEKLSDDQPWTWYEARPLITCFPGFVVAEVYEHFAGVFHPRRVCYWPKSAGTVRYNDFLVETFPAPSGAALTPAMSTLWNKRFKRTHPITISRNSFKFLQPRCDEALEEHMMEFTLREGLGMRGAPQIIRGTRKELARLNSIPPELLAMVFSNMDVRSLTALRRVCRYFNGVSSSLECKGHILMNVLCIPRALDKELSASINYLLASSFYFYMKPTTKYVMLTGEEMRAVRIRGTIRILCAIAKCKKMVVPNVVLTKMEIERDQLFDQNFTVTKSLGTLCRRLILKEMEFVCLFGVYNDGYQGVMPFQDLPVSFAAVNVHPCTDFLTTLELIARSVDEARYAVPDVLPKLARFIHGAGWISARRTNIVAILRKWHKSDSRFGSPASWQGVKVAKLNTVASLSTLSRCTVFALACLQRSCWDDDNDEESYFYSFPDRYDIRDEFDSPDEM
ncbi:uncharacterized protein LOC129589296 [Paramacrobiotus metropolitanus]|uniref:uncharacterized protein LOC129589296 n=1 Tax=Paramacrobiotus metropolitanus TaxID=2943436 RepID=UPI002445809E|nr:uncharacterized protein LOC129589296 [Paramacrobiotus metropolitanus]XP_055339958.1 uncharacterized protein LOC129589296 [Paramacrobiotus metropolitanus]